MSDLTEDPSTPAAKPAEAGIRPDAKTSIEPSILVKVDERANRDEITGAVARALVTSNVPFLKGRTSYPPAQMPKPTANEAGIAPKLEAGAEPDQTLTVTITTEGPPGGGN